MVPHLDIHCYIHYYLVSFGTLFTVAYVCACGECAGESTHEFYYGEWLRCSVGLILCCSGGTKSGLLCGFASEGFAQDEGVPDPRLNFFCM